MEDLPAREQAAEKNVHNLLKTPDEPLLNILSALEEYRHLAQQVIFADFEHAADKSSARLWLAHTETRKLLSRALSRARKANERVTLDTMTAVYKKFVSRSQRDYRDYIYKLNSNFGGIPELEAVAQKVKKAAADESLPRSVIGPELRQKVLEQCHQTLIYLGDLSRYRASEKLDKTPDKSNFEPDFGPAIGYYGLACSLVPSSGMGFHQQAVVALEERNHLKAICHLYRAIVVDRPHPNAQNNLKLEFDKTNMAWDRGELIQKGPLNDSEGPRRALIGWFVRLHSMCVKGEEFRGHEELEKEVLSQLTAEIKRRSLGNTIMRMLLVNFAAQYCAGENLKENSEKQSLHLQAYFYFFRFNVRFFTTLLDLFREDLASVDTSASNDDEPDLRARITPVACRILPSLRLYSTWLLIMAHVIHGLSSDDFLKADIARFWKAYASAMDAVVQTFPIWDLDELPESSYLLEEDVETLGFKPLFEHKSKRIWSDKATGNLRPRFSDRGVASLPMEEEMLGRIKALLEDGLFLANDDEQAPILLRGSRIVLKGTETDEVNPRVHEVQPKEAMQVDPKPAKKQQKPKAAAQVSKPLSYASAATNGHAKRPEPTTMPAPAPPRSRQEQLSRMVDDLVEDEDDGAANNSGILPVTPPQQPASHPVVVANGDMSYGSLPFVPQDMSHVAHHQPSPKPMAVRSNSATNSPGLRTPDHRSSPRPRDSRNISRLWNPMPNQEAAATASPHFSPSVPTGTLGSPAPMVSSHGHTRVNSASSLHSAASPNMNTPYVPGPWSSLPPQTSALQGLGQAPAMGGTGSSGYTALTSSINNSPLLFGAGGGMWSANGQQLQSGFHNATPPNGQGG